MVNTKFFYSELFYNVKKRADKDEILNMTLEPVFKHIGESKYGSDSKDNFSELFDNINVNRNKPGATVVKGNTNLGKLMNGIASMGLGHYKDNYIDDL